MAKISMQIRPQDVLVLLKLILRAKAQLRLSDLAREIGISQSEVSQAIERLRMARLILPHKREPIRANVLDFLLYGVPYVFPAKVGALARGVVTAHSADPLAKKIVSSESERYVWPDAEGTVRGQSINPLYRSAPVAAANDPKMHELLALVDALRIGRAREKQLAAEELKNRVELELPNHA